MNSLEKIKSKELRKAKKHAKSSFELLEVIEGTNIDGIERVGYDKVMSDYYKVVTLRKAKWLFELRTEQDFEGNIKKVEIERFSGNESKKVSDSDYKRQVIEIIDEEEQGRYIIVTFDDANNNYNKKTTIEVRMDIYGDILNTVLYINNCSIIPEKRGIAQDIISKILSRMPCKKIRQRTI